jgi:hypothetical protein
VCCLLLLLLHLPLLVQVANIAVAVKDKAQH